MFFAAFTRALILHVFQVCGYNPHSLSQNAKAMSISQVYVVLACSAIQGLKALLTMLIISLPAFYNVGALLMLVFFMYSYVAVLLFGSIQPQAAITPHANFSNFGQ